MNALSMLKKVSTHRYLALAFRMYIGGLFIYASMSKITYTAEFAEGIASYQVVPYWAVNISAVVFPWVELICGILLITGLRSKAASAMLALFLLFFTFLIGVSLSRDASISCGCFHAIGEDISLWTLFRDLIWTGMTIHVFFCDRMFQLEERFSLHIKEI